MATLEDIAQTLQNANKTQLIYAFNGTGKTRLSKIFKELLTPKNTDIGDDEELDSAQIKVLYYNAFTEDLFYWDNDLEFNKTPKLKIQPNSFTKWIFQEQGQDQNIISFFQHYTDEKLMPHFSSDFTEITFSFKRGNQEEEENIKISKGEESNFIWSIFYALLGNVVSLLNIPEQENRDTNQFDHLEYIYIDDPVSSLDENHLIELAVDLAQLIKSSQSEIKFIISTHNPLFYNVLFNELQKKSTYMLNKLDDGTFELKKEDGDSNIAFSYHIYLINILKRAIKENNIQKYHFTLLRNLYEKTSRFLGYKKWSEILPDDKTTYANRIMHFHSHKTISNEEIAEPTDQEKKTIEYLLDYLINTYKFDKDAI